MKEKYLIIEEFELHRSGAVMALLERLLEEEEVYLTIRWKFFSVRLNRSLLERIASLLYEQGVKKEFTVCCIVETAQWKEVYRLRKVLNRYGFEVLLHASPSLTVKSLKKTGQKMLLEELRIVGDDYESLRKEYERLKGAGIPITFDESRISTEQYMEWFQSWMSDRDACWLLPFRGMVGYMLTGAWLGGCEHGSCLGKYLCMDRDGALFFCEKKLEGSRMYEISSLPGEQLYDQNYERVLGHAVEKRRRCQAECGDFPVCRGGCPLQASGQEDCQACRKKIAYVSLFLQKHSRNYFANTVNPVIRQMFLSTMAFGFIPEEHGV